MKHTDLEPEQRQQPLGPATPRPVVAPKEWVPYAPGVERNVNNDWMRTVDKPTPAKTPLAEMAEAAYIAYPNAFWLDAP